MCINDCKAAGRLTNGDCLDGAMDKALYRWAVALEKMGANEEADALLRQLKRALRARDTAVSPEILALAQLVRDNLAEHKIRFTSSPEARKVHDERDKCFHGAPPAAMVVPYLGVICRPCDHVHANVRHSYLAEDIMATCPPDTIIPLAKGLIGMSVDAAMVCDWNMARMFAGLAVFLEHAAVFGDVFRAPMARAGHKKEETYATSSFYRNVADMERNNYSFVGYLTERIPCKCLAASHN